MQTNMESRTLSHKLGVVRLKNKVKLHVVNSWIPPKLPAVVTDCKFWLGPHAVTEDCGLKMLQSMTKCLWNTKRSHENGAASHLESYLIFTHGSNRLKYIEYWHLQWARMAWKQGCTLSLPWVGGAPCSLSAAGWHLLSHLPAGILQETSTHL